MLRRSGLATFASGGSYFVVQRIPLALALASLTPSISLTIFKPLLDNEHNLGHFFLCPPPRYAVNTFRQWKRAGTPGAFVKNIVTRERSLDETDANGLIDVASISCVRLMWRMDLRVV